MKSHTTRRVTIRVDLSGSNAERFLTIKETYGIRSNAELIRLLIAMVYQQMQKNQVEKKKT